MENAAKGWARRQASLVSGTGDACLILTPTNPRLALIAIAAVFAILNADITMVNVALVTLGKDLHADLEDLQWGLNSYMLAFAALIVAAGRVADVFGRRRCLLAGVRETDESSNS